MKWKDLQNKNTEELKELLSEQLGELHGLNFQAKAQQLKQVKKINTAKKTIARLKMLMRDRQAELMKK